MRFLTASMASLALAFGGTNSAVAQDEAAPDMLMTEALVCATLATFLSASAEDEGDAEAAAYFDDRGQRWLYMAMVRDGADGEIAEAKFFELIEAFTAEIESFGEDAAGIEAFLEDGVKGCVALREAHQEEYDSIELEEAAEEEEVE